MTSWVLRLGLVLSIILAGSSALAQNGAPASGAINIIVPDLYLTLRGEDETRLNAPSMLDPGGTLRSDETGVGLITWFYDGTESVLGPNSSLTLNAFRGAMAGDYTLDVSLHAGQLVTGLGDVAASSSGTLQITTPTFTVQPESGQFELRVQDAITTLIVTQGKVNVSVGGAAAFPVEAGEVLAGASGEPQALTSDGVTPVLEGVCTAETPTNLNVRLAPSEDSRRLGGITAGQPLWVRASTEGNLWLQVYYQTDPADEEAHNFGWIYGPAVILNADTCGGLLRAALNSALFGGPGEQDQQDASDTLAEPDELDESGETDEPAEPDEPGEPDDPDNPDNPDDPDNPDNPDDPDDSGS